jgi:hypothetical protein
MKRGHQFGGEFGLVRHQYVRHSFCSRRCVDRFKKKLAAQVLLRKMIPGWLRRSLGLLGDKSAIN